MNPLVKLFALLIVLAVGAAGCIPKEEMRPQRMDCDSEPCRDELVFRQVDDLLRQAESFHLAHGRFPSAEEGIAALLGKPLADPWGAPYLYRVSAEGIPMVVSLGSTGNPLDADMTPARWGHPEPEMLRLLRASER